MSATNNLRFVIRDGKRILQQEHFLPFCFDPNISDEDAAKFELPMEWRDVPLVNEEEE